MNVRTVLPGCGVRRAVKTFYCLIVASEDVSARRATKNAPCSLPNTSTRRFWAKSPSAST